MEKLVSLKTLLEREEEAVRIYNVNVEVLNEYNYYYENNLKKYEAEGLKEVFKREYLERVKTYNEDIEESLKEVKEVRNEIKDYFLKLD